MEILAVFNVEGALAKSRINWFRHDRGEPNAFNIRNTWKPQPTLGQR